MGDFSLRKSNLVGDGRMDDWQAERPNVGEWLGGFFGGLGFKPLEPPFRVAGHGKEKEAAEKSPVELGHHS